jgi:hypothetical protein
MRLTVTSETSTSAAICLPVQRWRRRASTFSTVAAGVGRLRRCGRELRSVNPARPSLRKRSNHFRTVRGQTPAARAAASAVCPLSTCITTRSRPNGVSRAFLCMFIRSSEEITEVCNLSFLAQDRMDNLLKAHS